MSIVTRLYRVRCMDAKKSFVGFQWFADAADARQFCKRYRKGSAVYTCVPITRTVYGLLAFANEYASSVGGEKNE